MITTAATISAPQSGIRGQGPIASKATISVPHSDLTEHSPFPPTAPILAPQVRYQGTRTDYNYVVHFSTTVRCLETRTDYTQGDHSITTIRHHRTRNILKHGNHSASRVRYHGTRTDCNYGDHLSPRLNITEYEPLRLGQPNLAPTPPSFPESSINPHNHLCHSRTSKSTLSSPPVPTPSCTQLIPHSSATKTQLYDINPYHHHSLSPAAN